MVEEKIALSPLIIDNTNSVFILNAIESQQWVYYYPAEDNADFTDVAYEFWAGGELIINAEAPKQTYANATQVIDTVIEHHELYAFPIATSDIAKLKINTPYILKIKAITKIGEEQINSSVWSEGVIKHVIWRPALKVYGGLTYEQSLQPSLSAHDQARLELKTGTILNQFDPTQIYRLRGELTFIPPDDNSKITEDDTLLWWQIAFYKGDERIENGTTGMEYPDRYWDLTGRKINSSFDGLNEFFTDSTDDRGTLVILYSTVKGYKGSLFFPIQTTNVEQNVELTNVIVAIQPVAYTKDNITEQLQALSRQSNFGYIELSCRIENQTTASIVGTLEIKRAESLNTDKTFSVIYQKTIVLTSSSISDILYYDQSAESGIPYVYQAVFYKEEGGNRQYSQNSQITAPVLLDIEDSFLITKERTLRIKYNPTLTNYKRNILEVVTPTLGGEYPFVRRNGKQKYRTFTFGGLISYHDNDTDIFYDQIVSVDSINQLKAETGINQIVPSSYPSFIHFDEQEYDLIIDAEKSLQFTDFIKEKLFRDKVLDFLHEDQIFLFKAPAEGNMFIRLSNITLTSNKTLGRMIYSFSATATEIMAPTAENYNAFFSDLYTSTNFTIRTVTIQGNVENGVLTTAEDNVNANSPENLTVRTNNATLSYKADTESGWTQEIKENVTYLDQFGRIVPVVATKNGQLMFKPGYFPETKVEKETQEATRIVDIYALKAKIKEFSFRG